MPLARTRIQRAEELVFHVHAGPRQGIHERALAGVGVADQGNRVLPQPAADLAFLASLHDFKSAAQVTDALADEPAVFFKLRLTGAAQADTTLDAAEVGPHLAQPRQGVFQLSQLDL